MVTKTQDTYGGVPPPQVAPKYETGNRQSFVAGNAAADSAVEQPKDYAPNADAIKGVWAATNLHSLASTSDEERMFSLPFGADHFFLVCQKLDVLIKLNQQLEYFGVPSAKSLDNFPAPLRLFQTTPAHNSSAMRNARWSVSICEIHDLKAYALGIEDDRLFRLKIFGETTAFPNSLILVGSIVLKSDSDGFQISEIIEGFDSKIHQFEPTPYTRSMVVCNLINAYNNTQKRGTYGGATMEITGCMGLDESWISDIRIKPAASAPGAVKQAPRVVKLVEHFGSGQLDVLIYSLYDEGSVAIVDRFDVLQLYIHDALTTVIYSYLNHDIERVAACESLTAMQVPGQVKADLSKSYFDK